MEAAYSLDIPFYVYGKHAFHAEDHDEVAFNQGDPVLVLERDELYADGWWKGRNNKGQEGLFPMNFVSLQKQQQQQHSQENRRSSLTHLVKALDDVSLDLNTTTTASASAPRISLDLNESTNKDAHPSLWSTPTVHRWLKTQNLAFAIPAFKLVDGKRLLELNLASLKELGIDSLGERMDLLHAILALKEEWITTGHLSSHLSSSSSPHHNNNNHNHRSSVSASVSTPSNVDSGFADEDAALHTDPYHRHHHPHHDGERDVTDVDSPLPDLHRERLRKAASHFTLSDYFYGDDPLLDADGNTKNDDEDDDEDGADRESQLETLRNTEINSGATSPRTLSGSGHTSPIPHGKPLPPRATAAAAAAANNNETIPVRPTHIGGMIGIPLPPSTTTTNDAPPSSSSNSHHPNTTTHNTTHHGSLTRSIHKSDDKEKDKDKRRSSSLFGMLGFGALHKKAKSSSIQSLSMLSIPPTTNNQNSTSVSPTTTSPSTTVSDDDLLMDTLLHTPDFSGSLYVKIHNRGPTGKFVGKQKQGNQKEVWKKRWCILGNDVLLICKHAPLSKANNHQNNQSNSQSMNGVDAYTHVVATVKLNGYKVLPLSSSETAVGGGFGFMIQPTQTKTQSEHHSARTSESGDPSNSLSPTLFFTSTSQYDTLTWINHLVRAASSHSSSDETGENTTTGGGKARLRSLIPIKHAQKMGSNVESHVEMGVESNVGLNVGLNVAQQQQQQLQPQQQQRRGSVIRTSIMSEPDHDTHTRSDTYNHPLTTTTYHQTSAPTRNFNGMNVNGGIVNGVNIKPVGAGAGVFARDNTPVRHLPWE